MARFRLALTVLLAAVLAGCSLFGDDQPSTATGSASSGGATGDRLNLSGV